MLLKKTLQVYNAQSNFKLEFIPGNIDLLFFQILNLSKRK